MGFRKDAYATIWSVEPGKGNFTKVRLSISRKNKETNTYEQDFSGFCTFIGQAHAKSASLRERDRIKLGDVDVSSTYDKEKKKEYINFKVFDYEAAESGNASSSSSAPDNPIEGENDENDTPF